ncbi:MAG: hypothetical protein AAFY00_07870, partial [Bacteroidota bacterium]
MKNSIYGLFLVCLFHSLFSNVIAQDEKHLSIQLTNGNWFNGNEFEKKTAWVHEGILRFAAGDHIYDTIIDLKDKYVIPPFAEAHNHNLESDYELEKRIKKYMDNGVFYVKHLSSIKKRIDPLMHHYNKPTGLDVSLAHAPLTATGGHPIALRKRFLEYGRFEGIFNTLEEIESHGYFVMDDEEQFNNKWEQVLSFQPDFIKINLLHSEEYEKRKNDTLYFGQKGLDPSLVPIIVAKAHEANLRVSAHVETAHDFHVAITAGVDEIAHLPEIRNGKSIATADAQLAKEKGIVVVTTASLVLKNRVKPNFDKLFDNVRSNLKILKDAGVTIAVGSDMYGDSSVGEFKLLYEFQVF